MRSRLVLAIGAVLALEEGSLSAGDLVVPVVLDVRSGTAHYRTEVTLTNRGTSPAALTLSYRGSLGSAAGTVSETLPAATQVTIPDAVAFLAARGVRFPSLEEGAPHAGTLRIGVPDAAAGEVSALARTTSPTSAPHPPGSAGLAYVAAPPTASFSGRAVVHGLRASPAERSNLAVFNAGAAPATSAPAFCRPVRMF